jgi:sulfofructose kinase
VDRGARALLVDGHDTKAAALAARWAQELRIPVIADLDNRYPGIEALLEHVDFAATSRRFPEIFMGETDLLKALPLIFEKFKCRLTAATLGRSGAIAWDGFEFHLCRGYKADAVDTTGAGDIFHGAFLYALVRGWPTPDILDFSCAAAALNCKAIGARGGIPSLLRIRELRGSGRRTAPLYKQDVLLAAARAARRDAGASR